ncbi:hypothetical protein LAZ67_5002631, partial [Cordylochernes scorpioides]
MPRKRSAIGVRTPAARRMAARAARGQSSRTLENPQQSQARPRSDRLRHRVQRASENPQQSQARLQNWPLDKQCLHCTAFRYNGERPGMCCSAGKVRIPDLPEPPEALRTLLDGSSPHSAEFMQRVRHYKNVFQMTSFGCGSRVVLPGYMPTFKVQGQVYHRIGSVLPPLNSDSRQLQPAFLQVFFIGESSAEADKAPPGHHPRTFNAPTINEVAIVIVQENCDRRDIVIFKRGSGVQRINEFHRSYDALQYPLVFWNGQDGYHFHIPQLIDGVPSAHKTVSCMDFYASLLMIRSRNPGITNWLLAFGDLTHQILVDIYAKVESKRLHYISAHQAQLRATEYINLLDAIRTDRSHALIGRQVILPSSFVGSPRHMHEYAQDCMAYVRKYGRPDLFITFTCNPEWPEIKLMQFPTQGAFVRHDLVARIFQLKVTKLIDLITEGDVLGKPQSWCYTIEWQKRGLPLAHILLWLKEKISPNQIDSIICAEIPNEGVDASLFRTVTKNMIHGPCGHGYPNPGCMERGRCQKKYPRLLLAETQTDRDGYPLYRRRRPEEGGFSFVKRVRVLTIENGVQVVRMTNVTIHNRYNGERPGMCCSAGKVRIPDLPEPPEALRTLLDGSSPHSAEFMQRVRHYKNVFQMTSFGCGSRVVLPGYMPTFKVQGQVYHRIGSVLPPLNSDSRQLQPAFLQLVIKADKTPPVHHPRTFNAPTINEVDIVIVQENCDRRDIVIFKRGSGVQRINEFHRSYDALQYPLVFWNGQDGYHFHIPQLIDGVPSAHKTVSCMDFYASLLMIRSRNPGITNWLLAFGDLTHQILVDIYAKVESKRLHYISAHQAQLRATEYINLLDAIRTDRSHALIGRQVILPSSFVGSPRHMHEYAQDCMAYVRKYGRPDLFITFTCNPEWPEIKLMQFPTQGAFVRHDLVARIFQLKVTKLIDLITEGDVFGKPQCWCYTIEWQKRGLPHAHILLWLKEKISPNQIDSIICAEIPNEGVDASLFRTVTKNMIHGPCGHGYPNPGCMERVTGAQTESNEVLEYQHGRYISSNEAVWLILGFPIHRRHPMVQHLSVHLENGQRVYFTSANAALQAHRSPKTTLTEFFALCQRDNLSKTLLYVEIPVYYIWSASKSWQPRKQAVDGVPSAHKTVSCMDFYASLLMIRSRNPGITNWLLAFGDLTHQILVDIYAKVESKRLHYISAHQAQLRATEYINLLDAIRTDRNHALIGRQVILPSSFVGSPRHMHEYAQDCMAYVRKYGRPDLFITFTCNPEWPEIKLMQFPTQGAFVRHDLVARIFQLKVTKLIDLITEDWPLDKQCLHCTAFRYNGERPGMCCSAGKVRIPDLPAPPEALRTLLDGSSPHSAEFMQCVRHYKNVFQMTSFGCGSRVVLPGYMPTFKVQGQVYHRIGSVLPPLNSDSRQLQPAFLQLIDGVPSAHKTVSCMDFYASLLMIRSRNPGITNWLLAFGDLTHQILVYIYAKVESKRLPYISAHQAQLRATEYINLLDAIRTDRSHALIGRQVILPSSFVGSPRHMHESIDQNPTLGNFKKLQYLNSALKGNAARLIRCSIFMMKIILLPGKPWSIYSTKKSELAFKQIQNLYDLKNVKQESTKYLLDLLDTCNESIQNLSILGLERNNLSDMILIHIIQSKLDRSIRKEWEMSLHEKEYPSYEKMISFLERFAGSLGSFQNKDNSKQFYKMNKSTHSHSATFASGSSIDSRVKSCVLCKGEHFLLKCPKFNGMMLPERWTFVKDNRLCYICLRSNHRVSSCVFTQNCKSCNKRHHTFLHQFKPEMLSPVADISLLTHASVSCFADNKSHDRILLSTALIKVKSENGVLQTCRALIDTGSQRCLITNSCRKKLNLPLAECKTTVFGLGNKLVEQSIGEVSLQFSPHFSNLIFNANPIVIDKITSELPNFFIEKDNWPYLKNLLADPNFDKSSQIDLVIGAELAPCLFTGKVRFQNLSGPTACGSKLGWLLTGKILLSGENSNQDITMFASEEQDDFLKKFWELEKWRSNVPEVLSGLSEQVEDRHNLWDFESDSCVKILGICWNPSLGIFQILVNDIPEQTNSKRHLLSHISRIFDPIGWLSPVIIRLKILLQSLWKQKLNWDDPLPDTLGSQWKKIENEISVLNKIQITRYFSCRGALLSVELHGFCDSSEVAYAAVFYIISRFKSGQVKVSLIASKTRVAPLKMISISRLELCAALLLATLYDTIPNSLCLQIDRVFLWTDSKIVLSWIKSESRHLKPFVGNRIAEIQRLTLHSSWHYVISKDNPADCASRGITPSELVDHSLWWRGPTWLSDVNFEDPIQTQYDFPKEISGPFLMKPNIKRSKVKLKSYVALFVCFCTKVIHIEIVSDLSSAAFLAALKRFISRRGKPSDIFSDNGTNFRGADNILREQFDILKYSTIQKFISNERINWHFIPPSAPNFGGIWEAGIKSFKCHLLRCLKSQILTFEELSTLTTQIEACLNSRPICPLSSDSDDFNPLTPGHFLIGRPLTALLESNDDDVPINYLDRWSLNKKNKNVFWKRWNREYLNNLQKRLKWQKSSPNIKEGELILLKDTISPPAMYWSLGRITEVFPGADGKVRVVE